MTTEPKRTGNSFPGRFMEVKSLSCTEGDHMVIMTCDGGNCYFQHSMTPTQARELAGYLQAEANYCEQQDKTETTDWSAS